MCSKHSRKFIGNRQKEADRKLLEISGYRLRIVERAGLKLRSLLHKSDPWDGQKCSDPRCLICTNPYNKKFGCSKRNIAYKSVCLTCKDEAVKADIEKKEKGDVGDTFEEKNDEEIPYIGESHVSGRERSIQHARDYSNKRDDSHQYKHYTDAHADLEMKDVKFGVTILRQFFSSFNRQHYEAVMIFKHSKNLNSKSMLYNRCKIPRLQVMFDELQENKKFENIDFDELGDEIEKLKQKHIREPGAEDIDPPPSKKVKRWHKFKTKKKKINDEIAFEKDSNLSETKETFLTTDPASEDLESTKADDKENGSKKLFPIFDPKSVFVFNATGKNVKIVATKTRSRRNKLRNDKSNNSIEKFLTKSRGNSTGQNQF